MRHLRRASSPSMYNKLSQLLQHTLSLKQKLTNFSLLTHRSLLHHASSPSVRNKLSQLLQHIPCYSKNIVCF